MKCQICKRELDVPGDVRSVDCGGDCLQCMAECGDTECQESLREAGLPVPQDPFKGTAPDDPRAISNGSRVS